MNRKILAICAAFGALAAFAIVPAMAAASPVLTENGVAVGTGSGITATGEETSTFSSGFITVHCNDYWMTGSVAKNSGSNIEGTIEGATFRGKNAAGETEGCESNLGSTTVSIPGLTNEGGAQHWCVKANAETGVDESEVVPRSCGVATGGEFTFVLTVGGTTCRYKRTLPIKSSYTTGGTQATLKLLGEPVFELESPSSFLCSGTGKLTKMSFVLETDASPFTPLTIS